MIGYLRFEIARMVRNRRYLFFTIGMPALFYLVFSQTGSNADAKIDGTTWGTYFMVSMAAFGALTAGFNAGGPRLAGERVSGWVRQLRITPLPGWAYVAVKVLTGVLMALPAIVVISAIAALDNHVSLAPTTWLQTVLALWAASIPFAALGVMFGFLINSETANPIMGIAMFLLAFFGGMFTPVQALPHTMATIAKFLPTYYAGSIGWALVAGQAPAMAHVAALAGFTALFSLVVLWRYRQDQTRVT